MGFGSRNDVSGQTSFYKDEWKEDFRLIVIGTSYCHSRMFKAHEDTYNWFKSFEVAKENVILAHKNLFDNVDKKMQKLKLGLKSYSCLLYTSPSPRDGLLSRMPSSA